MPRQHAVFARKLLMRLVRSCSENRRAPGAVETVIFEIMRLPVTKDIGASGDRKRIGFGMGDGIDHGRH